MSAAVTMSHAECIAADQPAMAWRWGAVVDIAHCPGRLLRAVAPGLFIARNP
jgi:hypothetical protein